MPLCSHVRVSSPITEITSCYIRQQKARRHITVTSVCRLFLFDFISHLLFSIYLEMSQYPPDPLIQENVLGISSTGGPK